MHIQLKRLVCLALLAVSFVSPAIAEDFTVTTYAGTQRGPGMVDATGTAAQFMSPRGVAVDAAGNVYVADSFAQTVRRISPAGAVTTLAGKADVEGLNHGDGGEARLSVPHDVVVDGSGNVYVSDNAGIRRISPDGVVASLTAEGAGYPLAVDASGNVFAADFASGNYVIKKVTPGGSVSTLSGVSSAAFITGLAVTAAGDVVLYTTFDGLYRRNANGTITPVASGNYQGVAIETSGNYVAVRGNEIVRVTPGGSVTSVAGSAQSGDADGFGGVAGFSGPNDVAIGPGGTIYVAEMFAYRVRAISTSNVVSTFAGFPPERGLINGPRLTARFADPADVVRDSGGNLFVVERLNAAIRKITPAGDVTTLTGGNGPGSTDGSPAQAKFWEPQGLAMDAAGNLYVTDTTLHNIRKVTPAGVVSTVAGFASSPGNVNGTGTAARFSQPVDLVAEADGTLYVADFGNGAIRKITPAGVVTTFATVNHPSGIARASDGTLYVTTFNSAVMKVTVPGAVVSTFAGMPDSIGDDDGTGTAARFNQLGRITMDDSGNLFVTDTFQLRKITTPGAVVTTVAGARFTTRSANMDGTGEDARFVSPRGMFAWGNGNLYIAGGAGNNVRFARPPGIDDVATISTPTAPLGVAVQLGTSAANATSWTWRILRRPAGSTAELSATNVREPVFSPDVADLFIFELRAEGPAGVRYSRVELTGDSECEPLGSIVATPQGSTQVCVTGTGATVTSNATSSNGETFQWGWRSTPGGAITDIGGATSSSYTLAGADFGGAGTKYLVLTVLSECGFQVHSNEVAIQVVTPPSAAINASTRVYANSTMNYASVADAGPGATYVWEIANGAILSGQGTRSIRYSAGASGEVTLGVVVTAACESLGDATVTIRSQAQTPGASLFYMVAPCRVLDTRGTSAVASGATLEVAVGGKCGVPVGAKAVFVNLTGVSPATDGFAALYRGGIAWPGTSTLNYRTGRTRANNALVEVAPDGRISLRNVGSATHFLIDVTGYFQ